MAHQEPMLFEELSLRRSNNYMTGSTSNKYPTKLPAKQLKQVITPKVLKMDRQGCDNILSAFEGMTGGAHGGMRFLMCRARLHQILDPRKQKQDSPEVHQQTRTEHPAREKGRHLQALPDDQPEGPQERSHQRHQKHPVHDPKPKCGKNVTLTRPGVNDSVDLASDLVFPVLSVDDARVQFLDSYTVSQHLPLAATRPFSLALLLLSFVGAAALEPLWVFPSLP